MKYLDKTRHKTPAIILLLFSFILTSHMLLGQTQHLLNQGAISVKKAEYKPDEGVIYFEMNVYGEIIKTVKSRTSHYIVSAGSHTLGANRTQLIIIDNDTGNEIPIMYIELGRQNEYQSGQYTAEAWRGFNINMVPKDTYDFSAFSNFKTSNDPTPAYPVSEPARRNMFISFIWHVPQDFLGKTFDFGVGGLATWIKARNTTQKGTYTLRNFKSRDLNSNTHLPEIAQIQNLSARYHCNQVELEWERTNPSSTYNDGNIFYEIFEEGQLVQTIHDDNLRKVNLDAQEDKKTYAVKMILPLIHNQFISQKTSKSKEISDATPVTDAVMEVIEEKCAETHKLTLRISWDGTEGAAGYEVVRMGHSSTDVGLATSFTDRRGIVYGEYYSYRIYSYDSACASRSKYDYVYTVTPRTPGEPPPAVTPDHLTGQLVAGTGVELKFNATGHNDNDIVAYTIYRVSDSGESTSYLVNKRDLAYESTEPTSTRYIFVDTNFEQCHYYTYTVTQVTGCGDESAPQETGIRVSTYEQRGGRYQTNEPCYEPEAVRNTAVLSQAILSPNPTVSSTTIYLEATRPGKVELMVTNSLYPISSQRQTYSVEAGINELVISTTHLRAGVYHAILSNESGETRSFQFIVED
ncbi:hypothetical protein FNH22_07030 [Fulvivirga sp. M361]|uniref:hypothetical protein n=1 Tax=Fulvivirga sp. M361 TaxID=2594266 RepID=UPI00117A4ACA|nr:hypothetical protein [Fulvivirga sp. M361]TRX60787.1 hypothetical protein FNH22_07030 [Fulvivirga sp. M361]